MSRMTSAPVASAAKRKVAGYARVSTDQEEQQTSYEAQVDYYTNYIQGREDWEFVRVYTDEGISATSTKHREGFQEMVQDALSGAIDLIVTKSVSRFARNTVDSLTTIRKLKEHGTEVYFEKENIWTFDSKGELLLTIMSSLAQEESRSISENVRWGQRKKFSDGKYSLNYKHFLGYDKGEDGRLVVNEEQAAIVRRIFGMFLAGHTPFQIAKTLTAEGIPTPAGKKQWSYTTVRRVLSNETYMGDKLLQKTYSIDFLSKDRLKNHGQVPQYYVEGDHEAIILPETFRRVQDELERRKGCHATGGSIFSGKIYCGECGQIYGSKVWHSNDPYRKVVWRCNGKYAGEKKCATPTITEDDVKRAFERMLKALRDDEVLENLREITVGDTAPLEREKARLERERDNAGLLAQQAISENARVAQDQAAYNERYNELAAEYDRLDEAVKTKEREIAAVKARQRRLEEFTRALEAADEEFTEGLWGSLVEKVTVFKDGLVFTLNSGEEMRVAPC
ncbi:MAG: recombinase family protein [Blautia sp.]|nr:recombinase family protein [Blautia sp.]